MCLLLLASFTGLSQQNAPVAGQASVLADLLKKDYAAIGPDQRQDALVQDRATVISVFKSFLRTSYPKSYVIYPADSAALVTTAIVQADSCLSALSLAKRVIANQPIATGVSPAVATTNVQIYNKNRDSFDVLQKTYYKSQATADDRQLSQLAFYYLLDSNRFVSEVISKFQFKYRQLSANRIDLMATVNANSAVQKALPLLGGSLDVSTTAIIDGISKFIAKRIKEELVAYAISNIQIWMNTKKSTTPLAELLVLLPTTLSYLQHYNPDKISSFPAELKQYIQNDINHLVDNAYNLRTTNYFKKLIAGHPDLELAFDAIPLIGKINNIQYPGDYINIISSSQLLTDLQSRPDSTSRNLASFINLLEMFSNSLTVTTNGEPAYTTVSFWKTYGKEPEFMKLYFGFLYQQDLKYYKIKLSRRNLSVIDLSKQLQSLMKDEAYAETMFSAVAPMLTNICKSSEKIYQQAQTIKKLNNGQQAVGADTVYNFAKSLIDLTSDLGSDADQLVALFSRSSEDNLQLADKMKPFILVANTCNDAVRAIRNKNYADGITQLLNLVNTLDPGSIPHLKDYLAVASFSTHFNPVWDGWKQMRVLKDNPNVISPSLAAAAVNISAELIRIEAFYVANTLRPDPVILTTIDNLTNSLQKLSTNGNLPAIHVSELKTLLTDNRFQQLIVSYYDGYLLHPLRDEMLQLNYKGAPVFSPAEVTKVTIDLDAYINTIFHAKIVQDMPVNPTLLTAEQNIAVDIEVPLSRIKFENKQLDSTVVSIVHLVNDMAVAKTSDDVEHAVEAFALPTGSYSVKQKSAFNVAINTYPGVLFAREVGISGVPSANTLGFTAPVGFSVTWGNVLGSDLGVFVPVIDLGAVTQLRLSNNGQTSPLPQLTWKNFLSPGLFITYGIPKSPFSINAGVQYGPDVQTSSLTSGTSTFRVGLGITIDIPFLNLYTKPQTPKK